MSLPNPDPLFKAIRGLLEKRTGAGFRTQAEVDGINHAILLSLQEPITTPAPMIQLGLTPADFAAAAKSLGCTVAQIRAIWEVECEGKGWFTDVRGDILALDGPGGFIDGHALPKILFEAHWFHKFTNGKYAKTHPNLSSPTWNRSLYVGGQGEWARLHRAMQLDEEAALKSASVGGPQIMGFNHKLAGFSTVRAFWDAMKGSERAHLDAFVAFIKNSGLTQAVRQISNVHAANRPFARGYNGSGYEKNQYHIKIARAHKKWSGT